MSILALVSVYTMLKQNTCQRYTVINPTRQKISITETIAGQK